MLFPTSGVEVSPLIPPLVSFCISFVCSTAGVTGAFLLLPFQVSVLGFTGPAVTATNHFYNVCAGIGGPLQYFREGRMLWSLAVILIIGTVPGVVGGTLIRIYLLPDPHNFKLFMGMVLLILGIYMLWKKPGASQNNRSLYKEGSASGISTSKFNLIKTEYLFQGQLHTINVPLVITFSLIIGLIGGAYGIGGGSLTAAFLIGVCRLPVYTTAGATMLATFVTSIIGVLSFTTFGIIFSQSGVAITPDWQLGFLFGIGGLAGTYLGARTQKFIPAKFIRLLLVFLLLLLAVKYTVEFIRYYY